MRIAHGLLGVAAAAALAIAPAQAADPVKIGYITTLSGPPGIIGKQMKDAFDLALVHLDGKLGGLPAEVIYGDDQQKPDVGVEVANRMVKRDRVDFVAGIIWSNVLMAIVPPVTRSGTFLLSSNAGPSPLAGKQCNENLFVVSWQNDQTPEAMGHYLQEQGVEELYLLAPNYQAGKDMLSGVERKFKGKVVGKVFTKLGQSDYQTEISAMRAANPKAVFVFVPGGMGINFVKQYQQAGLLGQIPLYTAFTVDGTTLPALKGIAKGVLGTQTWSADLDNPVNKKFVADFRKTYNYVPSFYAAQAYDTAMLLDAAIHEAGGVADKDKLRQALRTVKFPNTRGKFKFNRNHFPIQDFYLREVVEDSDGTYTTKIVAKVFEDYADSYVGDCPMKW